MNRVKFNFDLLLIFELIRRFSDKNSIAAFIPIYHNDLFLTYMYTT